MEVLTNASRKLSDLFFRIVAHRKAYTRKTLVYTMQCPLCKGQGQVYDTAHEAYDPCDLCDAKGTAEPSKVFNHVGDSRTLVLHFPTTDAALQFKTWLCTSGEQDFLNPQESLLEDGDITPQDYITSFEYHTGDNTVVARCEYEEVK